MTVAQTTPLVEMRNINISFGGLHAVRDVSLDLYPGELVDVYVSDKGPPPVRSLSAAGGETHAP